MPAWRELSGRERLLSLALTARMPLLIVGALGAAARWRPAAFILLAYLVTTIGLNLVIGAVEYRRTMSRPWPKVTALGDDDDDW